MMQYNLKYTVEYYTPERALKIDSIFKILVEDIRYLTTDTEFEKQIKKVRLNTHIDLPTKDRKTQEMMLQRDVLPYVKYIAVCDSSNAHAKQEILNRTNTVVERIRQNIYDNVEFYYIF